MDHGVKGVGDGQDAGGQRDLLAFEAVGIPAAVVALVVMADHLRDVPQKPDGPHYIFADDGVGLDQLELFIRQPAGLVEHGVADADFPDVVEQPRVARSISRNHFATTLAKYGTPLSSDDVGPINPGALHPQGLESGG